MSHPTLPKNTAKDPARGTAPPNSSYIYENPETERDPFGSNKKHAIDKFGIGHSQNLKSRLSNQAQQN